MDIQKFIRERPHLYHLTSVSNAEIIIAKKQIFSANELIKLSDNKKDLAIQKQKRFDHHELLINGVSYFLRDQRPISEKALAKCLTDGWSVGDFLFHLNDRVFMWPTLDRLWRHYNRYEAETPWIFRFPTKEIIEANPHVQFCRLNSGATRANSYLGGKPPARGSQTFLAADQFNFSVRDVAEVTFPNYCNIDVDFQVGTAPNSDFKSV